MLIQAHRLHQLSFSKLMEVYRESNLKKTASGGDFSLLEEEQRFYDYLTRIFFRTPGAVYAIWEEGGRYACAARLEPYRDGLLLAGLETAPALRGRGYARTLLSSVQSALPEGTLVYSHVHKENRISMNLHTQMGFRCVSESAVYIDGSADSRCRTLLWTKNTAPR